MNKYSYLVIVSVLIIILTIKINTKIKDKFDKESKIIQLPNFTFYNQLHQKFTKDSILKNRSCLFIYFNTDCEHCQHMASQIVKYANALKNFNILFISDQPYKYIFQFDNAYRLTKYPFIQVLKDSSDNFYKTFGTSTIPSHILYNNDGVFLKSYKGEVDIITIITQLNKDN